MKTTIELPDSLLIQAKKKAAERRVPLRVLVEKGLRAQIAETPKPVRRVIRWITVKGGLPRGLDVRRRETMIEWIGKQR